MAITKNDVEDWKASEITQAWFQGIYQKIADIERVLSSGGTLNADSAENTAINTAQLVGRAQGLRDTLDIDDNVVIEGKR